MKTQKISLPVVGYGFCTYCGKWKKMIIDNRKEKWLPSSMCTSCDETGYGTYDPDLQGKNLRPCNYKFVDF